MSKQAQDLFVAIGVILAIIGGLIWGLTNSSYTACQNAFISALNQSQCNGIDFWHAIGIGGIAAGVIGVFIGTITRLGRQ